MNTPRPAKRPPLDDNPKAALKAMHKARDFPGNTCPASRHAALIAEHLIKHGQMHMLTDEPGHCGESIAHTVAALWRARTEKHARCSAAVSDAERARDSAAQVRDAALAALHEVDRLAGHDDALTEWRERWAHLWA
jgi:hypothetical protein